MTSLKDQLARLRRVAFEVLDTCTDLEASEKQETEIKLLRDVAACLKHAVELGHVGEGSTGDWAKTVLAVLDAHDEASAT